MRQWTTVGVYDSYDKARRAKRRMRSQGFWPGRATCPHHEHVTLKVKRVGPKGSQFKVVIDTNHHNTPDTYKAPGGGKQ